MLETISSPACRSLNNVRRYFSVSCILIIPVFRAPTLLDGTFCRFFVGSSVTGCCPLEKLCISACKSHRWVIQHQASSNKKVKIRKQIDCVATKDFAHGYNFVSGYRCSKILQTFKKPTLSLTTSYSSCHLFFSSQLSKSRGKFPLHRAGFLSRLSSWGFY